MAVFAAFCPGWPCADFALAEIIEYVRVSVQIVFEELGAAGYGESVLPATMSEH